ncbi:MAG: pirin family protein [Planctomycetota bacterium]
MITIRRSEERGHADHGWLDAHHTFSFADYFDPDFVQFGTLRVINQDRVKPGKGFPTHGHRDMEIVTYVLDGLLEHRDSMGNGSQIRPGEVQYMSAGRGVTHSEFNASATDELHLLQMWVLPRKSGGEPRYDQKDFPEAERRGKLRLVVSPDGRDGSITIGQDAELRVGTLDAGDRVRQSIPADRVAWLHVAKGRVKLDGEELGPGDGAGIRDAATIELEGVEHADVVLWTLTE